MAWYHDPGNYIKIKAAVVGTSSGCSRLDSQMILWTPRANKGRGRNPHVFLNLKLQLDAEVKYVHSSYFKWQTWTGLKYWKFPNLTQKRGIGTEVQAESLALSGEPELGSKPCFPKIYKINSICSKDCSCFSYSLSEVTIVVKKEKINKTINHFHLIKLALQPRILENISPLTDCAY